MPRSRTRRARTKAAQPSSPPAAPATPGPVAPAAAWRVVHPFPSLLVTALTLAIVPLADRDASLALYLQLGLGMLCFQFAIGVANDVADAELDAVTKPWKPIAAGRISLQTAKLLTVLFAGAGLAATIGLDAAAWFIGLAGLLCGLAYDLALKRTVLSFVPWLVAFPLIPAWVFTAANAWDAILWWAFPLGALFALAIQFANQSPGAAEDRAQGVAGVPQRLGARASALAALACFGAAASLAAGILLFADTGRAMLVAAVAALALFLVPRATRFFGRDGLFGLLAASSAAIAIVFLSVV